MITKARIEKIVSEKIAGTAIFLVDIDVKAGNKIFVYIEKPGKITISDCEEISRHIEKNLDRNKEDFELVVSSPGLGRPFKVAEQYKIAIGKYLEVLTKNSEKYVGKLVNFEGESIEIEIEKIVKTERNKKTTEKQIINIPIFDIKTAKEQIKIK